MKHQRMLWYVTSGGITMASKTVENITETLNIFAMILLSTAVYWKVYALLCAQYKPQELNPAVYPILINC